MQTFQKQNIFHFCFNFVSRENNIFRRLLYGFVEWTVLLPTVYSAAVWDIYNPFKNAPKMGKNFVAILYFEKFSKSLFSLYEILKIYISALQRPIDFGLVPYDR